MVILAGFDIERVLLLIVMIGLTIYSFRRGWKQAHSGSKVEQPGHSGSTMYSDENYPFYLCGGFVFGCILAAATVGMFFWMLNEA
jgi:hypothetical protein